MAFLSLGLQNDEPTASSDRGKNEPVFDSLHSEKKPVRTNGNGNGNGHRALNTASSASLSGDEFEADKFDDEVDRSNSAAGLSTWMAAQSVRKPIDGANDSERAGAPTSARTQADSPYTPVSLPAGVEQLRRK